MSGIVTQPGRHIAELRDGGVSFDAPSGQAFVTALGKAFLVSNAYFDGTNWLRRNTSAAAVAWVVDGVGQVLESRWVAAGANPIVWTTVSLGQDSGWLGAAGLYNANWADYDASHTVQYRKDTTGRVWLRGLAKKAVALVLPDTIFFLPAGFRPLRGDNPIKSVASASQTYTEVRVQTTGAVQLATAAAGVWWGLDNISFDTV
jgi:hypothetical protein